MFGLLKSLLRNAPTPKRAPPLALPDREFVAFVTPVEAPHFLAAGESLNSDMASMRLRVGVPAQELAKKIPVGLIPIGYLRNDPGLATLGRVRAIVVGKQPVRFFTQERDSASELLDWVESAAMRCRVIVDFSDDLAAAAEMFSEPSLLDAQRRLLGACHGTVPTQALKERLTPYARHGITVIEDPYESATAGEPRLECGAAIKLAWFGVFGEPLRPFIEGQFAEIAGRLAPRALELAFVTYAGMAPLVEQMADRLHSVNPNLSVRHIAWSLHAAAEALSRADIVVLPQDAGSDWGRVKSHNRLVEALRAGRFTVATPIPSYLELAPYAWVEDDLAAGIEWALTHPPDALARVRAGQAHVAERFSPARIGAQWAQALGV